MLWCAVQNGCCRAIDKALGGIEPQLTEEEATESAIQFLCEQMQISRKTALKYLAYAKNNKQD